MPRGNLECVTPRFLALPAIASALRDERFAAAAALAARHRVDLNLLVDYGTFYTLVPIRPRSRGERRSLRTFAVVSLRPGSLAFNPRPRRLSTPLLTPFNSTPQESYGEASHAAKVSVEESELDFCDGELSARRLHDKVRGFAGWPGTKATFAVRKETEAAADAKEV